MTERRPYFWRTLRSDFLDMCDRNLCAALLLDYFHTCEIHSMGQRTQGARDSGYYELSRSFASAVVLIDVGKNTVHTALKLLIQKGFISAHPYNGKSGWVNRNRYRPNMPAILQAANEWQTAHPNWSSETQQSVQPDQSIGPVGPIQLVHLDQSIGLVGPQDRERDKEYESAAAATNPLPPPLLIADSLKAYFGRTPTPMELQIGAALVLRHGQAHVRAAIEDAASKGGRSMKYVEQIANNADARPTAAAQPERTYFTAPEDDAPAMTADEIAQTKAELQAMRTAMRNGGA
jgi:hypothetical protein